MLEDFGAAAGEAVLLPVAANAVDVACGEGEVVALLWLPKLVALADLRTDTGRDFPFPLFETGKLDLFVALPGGEDDKGEAEAEAAAAATTLSKAGCCLLTSKLRFRERRQAPRPDRTRMGEYEGPPEGRTCADDTEVPTQ